MRYLLFISLFFLGCTEGEKALVVYYEEVPIKPGEIQVVIKPEYDHYYFGENIWMKVSIKNNTDEDFYVTYLPDVLSVSLVVLNNDGTRIYSHENDERIGYRDSTKVPPHTEFNSLINLSNFYFPQRKVTKGLYTISGEYEKYPHRKILSASLIPRSITIDYPPAIKTNTIRIEISPTEGIEDELYNELYWQTSMRFNNEPEKLEYLMKEYPDSKFYPQIYCDYIYYLQDDSAEFFENVNYFFKNVNSYESILLLHRLDKYLKIKLNWNFEKRKDYFISLKNKYNGEKFKDCIELKLATLERFSN